LTIDLTGHESPSQTWYDTVIAPWRDRFTLPPRERHDIDATLRALRVLADAAWLLRPVLVRSWFDAARTLTDGPALHETAGRRAATELHPAGFPCVPGPKLARQYIEGRRRPATERRARRPISPGDLAMRLRLSAMLPLAATVLAVGMPALPAAAQDAGALRLKALAATCANCHGTQGRAVDGAAVPGLAGMPAAYMIEQ